MNYFDSIRHSAEEWADDTYPPELYPGERGDELAKAYVEGVRFAVDVVEEDAAAGRLAFADAAMNLGGHEVTEPTLREIVVRLSRDEITAEEARDLIHKWKDRGGDK